MARGAAALSILETCKSTQAANDAERRWIAQLRRTMRLMNVSDGGREGYGDYWKARLDAATNTPEYRESLSVAPAQHGLIRSCAHRG
jgi:hypothetical protein